MKEKYTSLYCIKKLERYTKNWSSVVRGEGDGNCRGDTEIRFFIITFLYLFSGSYKLCRNVHTIINYSLFVYKMIVLLHALFNFTFISILDLK